MSGCARKRNSKWETKEDSQFLHRGKQENDWYENRITSIPDNRSRVWRSPEATSVYHTHWSSMGRGSQRDDNIVEHRGRTLDTMTRWEGGERYGSRLSPDLDDLRLQNRYHSPKNGWRRQRRSKSRSRSRSRSQPRSSRRSRSRSPVHSFRRESGDYDRSRGRLGSSSQLCRNFVAGRCKRGDRCSFVHQETQNYKDRFEGREKHVHSMHSDHHVSREDRGWSPRPIQWCEDFLKGNCRRGTTCRFSHPDDPNASGMVMKNVAVRERNDRSTDLSLERPSERETHSAFDVPCKFFAAGRCRNGKHCRFSHHDQAHASPDKKSPEGRWPLSHNENGSENLLNGPPCSDLDTSYDNHNISDECAKVGVPDWVTGWSMDGKCGKSLDDNRSQSVPVVDQKAVEIDMMESLQSMTDHLGDSFRACEQGSSKSQIEDVEMSPEWNYRLGLPSHSDKGGLNSMHSSETNNYTEMSGVLIPTVFNGLSSVQQKNLREVGATDLPSEDKAFVGKKADLCDISANFLGGEGSNETGLALNPLSLPCLNDFGQSQVTVNTESSRALGIGNSLIQALSQEGKEVNELVEGNARASQVSSGIPKLQNLASNEQLSQLNDLEASLVQFIANASGQKPQFNAANGPHNGKEMPAFAHPDGSVEPVSAVGIQEIIADGKPEVPCKNLSSSVTRSPSNRNGGERNKFNTSGKESSDENCRLSKLELGLNLELTNASFGMRTKESRKTEETAEVHGLLEINDGDVPGDDKIHRYRQEKMERRKAQVNDSLENLDENKNADKSKESKDTKVLRPFKFALAEFVKELLKPKWKEGQMSKDSYKIIVKKVVDKVTITLHGANIPHTQQKIEQYLSVSKPKLTKLVQAYVEKFQKEK